MEVMADMRIPVYLDGLWKGSSTPDFVSSSH
jgi:hypothetical protein